LDVLERVIAGAAGGSTKHLAKHEDSDQQLQHSKRQLRGSGRPDQEEKLLLGGIQKSSKYRFYAIVKD